MSDAGTSRIRNEVDLSAEGKHAGYLRIPHSVHRSAYGWIPVPIVSIRNGEGPRVLLLSGNHGDEYEGLTIVMRFAREMEATDIRGHVIVLPAANAPAVMAGRRTSPLDYEGEGNLNRVFPGEADGPPTSAMAHYIQSELLPVVDYAFDLHSGGSSIAHWPSCKIRLLGDAAKDDLQLRLLKAFGAPLGIVGDRVGPTTLSAMTMQRGITYVSTELGGGGTVTPWIKDLGEAGLKRCLKLLGTLPEDYPVEEARPTRLCRMSDDDHYVYAYEGGIFEPVVNLGDEVEAGQRAGHIHFPAIPWRTPSELTFKRGGVVFCKRVPSRCEAGDCLFILLPDYEQ